VREPCIRLGAQPHHPAPQRFHEIFGERRAGRRLGSASICVHMEEMIGFETVAINCAVEESRHEVGETDVSQEQLSQAQLSSLLSSVTSSTPSAMEDHTEQGAKLWCFVISDCH
jgi:hypothetical protein